MRYQILCDTCCDFTATEKMSTVFSRVPAKLTLSGYSFLDDKAFRQGAFLEVWDEKSFELKAEFPDEDAWLARISSDAARIYLVTASAAVFDQYEVASSAKRRYLEQHPDAQIHVFNTRSFGVAELLAARQINRMERSGCEFRQIVERVENDILKRELYLLPSSPEQLQQSSAIVNRSTVRGKDIYRTADDGRLMRVATALSAKGAEKKLLRILEKSGNKNHACLIAHCGCIERAHRVSNLLHTKCGIKNIVLLEACAVSSAILQPGGIAIALE